ncbi:hypothetical protein [Catenulispora subtropica]|uniref:Uncharacterized protein n=1 Tax=Catenulispora subtropica TaxID=450798 RepID=A0ABN2S0N7_9ACTN
MARRFHPERVEYDLRIAHPDTRQAAAGATLWSTAAVDAVTPKPLNDREALKDYALALVSRLQDFAEHTAAAPFGEEASSALRHDAYRKVRAVIRDKDGAALAEVQADGRVSLPGELDPDLRGRITGLVNVGLPMILRTVDQGGYETALESLVKARSVVNATLQAVLNMAVSAPEPVPRERLAAALNVQPTDLEHWYAGRAT